MQKYFEAGYKSLNWYTDEPEKIINLLPEFEGLPIIRTFAVTSMSTSIEANVSLALKALIQMREHREIKGYLPNIEKYIKLIQVGNDVPGRKIMSFIKALEGDPDAVVVDIWMCRAIDIVRPRTLPNGRPYIQSPTRLDYDYAESFCRDQAKRLNVEARQYQACVWSGIKKDKGMTKNVTWSSLLLKKRGLIFKF